MDTAVTGDIIQLAGLSKATVADKDACGWFDSVVNQYHPIKSTRFDIYSGIIQIEMARETLASVIGDLPKGLLSLIRRPPPALKLAFAKAMN